MQLTPNWSSCREYQLSNPISSLLTCSYDQMSPRTFHIFIQQIFLSSYYMPTIIWHLNPQAKVQIPQQVNTVLQIWSLFINPAFIFSYVPSHSLGANRPELLKESWHLEPKFSHILLSLPEMPHCDLLCCNNFVLYLKTNIKCHLLLSFFPPHLCYFVFPTLFHSILCVSSCQSTFYIVWLLNMYLCFFLTWL